MKKQVGFDHNAEVWLHSLSCANPIVSVTYNVETPEAVVIHLALALAIATKLYYLSSQRKLMSTAARYSYDVPRKHTLRTRSTRFRNLITKQRGVECVMCLPKPAFPFSISREMTTTATCRFGYPIITSGTVDHLPCD